MRDCAFFDFELLRSTGPDFILFTCCLTIHGLFYAAALGFFYRFNYFLPIFMQTFIREFSSFPLLKHSSSYLYILIIYVHVGVNSRFEVTSHWKVASRCTSIY